MAKFLNRARPMASNLLPGPFHSEAQYLNLIGKTLRKGTWQEGRNGGTVSLFGEKMEFSLEKNRVPVLTTKKFAWKTCLKELLWFISGSTNNKLLSDQNVGIWNDNASQEFKKSININYKNPNDLGPIYGHQWRFFNAKYTGCDDDYSKQGVDQLDYIIKSLEDPETRYSRRLVMSAWNPCQLHEMVLPPCHILTHFSVNRDDELSCAIYQRSGDIGLGVPFNIASYSFLTCLIAQHCNLKPKKLVHFIGDAHIYYSHIPALKEQMSRRPYLPPIFRINERDNINDYILDDFKLDNYSSYPAIKMDMIA